ncbi:hypothetical protein BJ878DRAFT_538905 [Calycina marina]|uniref:Calpain catalytic domain-containing protein n=1 Tax=Calycina marina TaxID=1763456 RepID=A0A9P7Z9K7_9HELO|nr:hypothetical protein BJ878DRAFT_538905 [Calycina marina]
MEAQALAAESIIDSCLSKEEALKQAIVATELYMKAVKLASSDQQRTKLRSRCKELVSRAEQIKSASVWPPVKVDTVLKAPVSERAITRTEEIILLQGSKLHGFIFPPWKSDPDDTVFEGNLYTEAQDLEISEAQQENFAGWKRPNHTQIITPEATDDDPVEATMSSIDSVDLVQDIATDCSVVASLCAGTARAVKGHGRLLHSVIFPYDQVKQQPRLSPNGKYIFRLNFNGCFRRVTIDDRLPASSTTRNLHVIDRKNPKLLWPALIEKAYLKVRGGYDFPGSNSNTDLWIMTGWIPEQEFLQSDELQPQQLWQRAFKSFGYGDVIITLGTGKLTCKEEKQLGLVGEHDYAVLDMKEAGSQRILLIKNPWCDGKIWKGARKPSTSAYDSWTTDLYHELPAATSPGTFWMNFEAVAQHFESLYLNWNPGLFTRRQDHHFSWKIPQFNTPGSFTHNPQYAVKSATRGTMWLLLSRHFAIGEHDLMKTQPKPSSGTLGYISLYVFEAGGRRVYLSDDAMHRGAFVDSPQTLARLEISPSTPLTIVVAHHDLPMPSYAFTLSFFSRSPLMVHSAEDALTHCTTHHGSWTNPTAGGNASAASYPLNPQFSVDIPSASSLNLILETGAPELAVQVKLIWANGQRATNVTAKDIVGSSGEYRRGCALASISNVQAGKYTIVCSTFEAGQLGDFTLRVGSEVPCVVRSIPAETAGRLSLVLQPVIFESVDRMLCPLKPNRLTKLRIVGRSKSRPMLRISLERGQGPNKEVLEISNGGDFSDAPMGIRIADVDVSFQMAARCGLWIVVERLGGRGAVDEVEVEILSEAPVSVGRWGFGEG